MVLKSNCKNHCKMCTDNSPQATDQYDHYDPTPLSPSPEIYIRIKFNKATNYTDLGIINNYCQPRYVHAIILSNTLRYMKELVI